MREEILSQHYADYLARIKMVADLRTMCLDLLLEFVPPRSGTFAMHKSATEQIWQRFYRDIGEEKPCSCDVCDAERVIDKLEGRR